MVSIAIIVVGPKDFPIMIKKIGGWVGSIKRYIGNVQSQETEITDVDNSDNLNKKNEKVVKKEDNNV